MDSSRTEHSLRIADLLFKQKIGGLTDLEQQELEACLSADPLLKQRIDDLNKNSELHNELGLMNAFDPETSLKRYQQQYFPTRNSQKLWRRVTIAAALFCILFGVALFYGLPHTDSALVSEQQNSVAPGRSAATLTLASGKKIYLTDSIHGVLADESGVIIRKSNGGELIYELRNDSPDEVINTLSTAKGETFRLRLPDGSSVWLNAASTLSYSNKLLKEGRRSVKLEGEGYFEIAKDAAHPFIVTSSGQQVEVLGTHFNISAYPEEETVRTTLIEGLVKVIPDAGLAQMLKPGQQAQLNGGLVHIAQVEPDLAVAWKNNQFLFEDEELASIMLKISRWYDVQVKYSDQVGKVKFGGGMSRFDHISKVLKSLEETGQVHFRLEGRTIYVSK